MTDIAPVRREVLVNAPTSTAFALFTAHLGAWWPVESFSVFGAGSTVAIEGDKIVERFGRDTAEWGTITQWDDPRILAFTWHPGQDVDRATDVSVSFEDKGDQTLVSLVHSGWERLDDPHGAAQEYGHGWPAVLAAFDRLSAVEVVSAVEDVEWFALVNTPGPSLADGETTFSNPHFQEHVAFLKRMQVRGFLVAAGPLPDQVGTGMAVLRVPASAGVDVRELAEKDDQCVAAGYLQVDVRPWSVMFTG